MNENVLYEIGNDEIMEIIKTTRFPKNTVIELTHVRNCYDCNSFIDVAFYINGVATPPEVLYTHIYSSDIWKFRKLKERTN